MEAGSLIHGLSLGVDDELGLNLLGLPRSAPLHPLSSHTHTAQQLYRSSSSGMPMNHISVLVVDDDPVVSGPGAHAAHGLPARAAARWGLSLAVLL